MKKALTSGLFLILVFLGVTAFAQQLTTFYDKEHNIQLDLPANWKTSNGAHGNIPYLEAVSPDKSIYMYVHVYKDAKISTKDLLQQAIDQLGLKLKGTYQEEDINGLHAFVAEASGKLEGQPVGLFILAATYEENNYVAYIFTEQDKFEKNAKLMNQILDSFRPIEE